MALTKKLLISSAVLLLLILTACSHQTANAPKREKPALEVKGQTVAQSQTIGQEYEYPALVLSEQEAKIIAKTSGTVKRMNFKLGDSVKVGSVLARIDDINQGGGLGSGLSSNQVRQAQLAVEQAETNKRNIALTSAENLRSAQIAHESAKILSQQARLNLQNRELSASQSYGDVGTNANTAAQAAADGCGAIITGINNIANFEPTAVADSSYKNNLGVANSQLTIDAKNAFAATKNLYDKYSTTNHNDAKTNVDETIKLIQQTSRLVNITKKYLDASLVGGALTQTILNGFQATVAGYQTQLNGALAQVNGAKQALENNQINNQASLDVLAKAYDLSKQQEKSALQALTSLQTNIKSMLEAADLQYRNAALGLQGIIDIHLVVAPLSGKITQSFITQGETVSAGQQLATVGSGQAVKLQFFVEEDILRKINLGQTVTVKNNENKEVLGKITGLSPQADGLSKRFLVEASPADSGAGDFSLGTVVNVVISLEKKSGAGAVVLPLAAVEIGQNGNAVFVIDNGRAKRTPVEIVKISGETAEIKTTLPASAVIITEGNKLLREGDAVVLTK